MKLNSHTKQFAWWHILLCICLSLTIMACRQKPAFFAFHSTPVEGWEQGDTLHFHVDSIEQTGNYHMLMGIRYSAATAYPFQSLWLVVRQHWHKPEMQRCDTVECKLTNADGDIKGTGVSIYQVEQPFMDLQLEQGATADISINHIMRREMLPGITDVGLKISRE